jgi:hypothetical protein
LRVFENHTQSLTLHPIALSLTLTLTLAITPYCARLQPIALTLTLALKLTLALAQSHPPNHTDPIEWHPHAITQHESLLCSLIVYAARVLSQSSDADSHVLLACVLAETDGADLVGQITPYSGIEVLQRLPRQALALVQRFHAACKDAGSGSSATAGHLRAADRAYQLATAELPQLVDAYVQNASAQRAAAGPAHGGSDGGSALEGSVGDDLELLDLLRSEHQLLSEADQQAAAEQAALEAPFGGDMQVDDGYDFDGFGSPEHGFGGGDADASWLEVGGAGSDGGDVVMDGDGCSEDGDMWDGGQPDGGQQDDDDDAGGGFSCEEEDDAGMWGSDSDAEDQQEGAGTAGGAAMPGGVEGLLATAAATPGTAPPPPAAAAAAAATAAPETTGLLEAALEGRMSSGGSDLELLDNGTAKQPSLSATPPASPEKATSLSAPGDAVPTRDQHAAVAPPMPSAPADTPTQSAAHRDNFSGASPLSPPHAAAAPDVAQDDSSTQAVGGLPGELCAAVEALIDCLKFLTTCPALDDPTSRSMLAKLQSTWGQLASPAASSQGTVSQTLFLFRDGPVTAACKAGHHVLLEDFDSPSQAVTECLNSLLETEPSFSVPEDITQGGHELASSAVDIADGFQVFATVHAAEGSSGTRKVNLSPASKSRFTVVLTPAYSGAELVEIIQHQLAAALVAAQHGGSQQEVANLTTSLFDLRAIVQAAGLAPPSGELHQLFKWAQYICTAPGNASLELRLLVGARFFYLDHLTFAAQQAQVQAWWQQRAPSAADPLPPLYASIFSAPAEDLLQKPLAVVGKDLVQLRYTHVTAALHPDSRLLDYAAIAGRLHLAPTPTLVNNMARIFAGLAIRAPLLLEGPPGTGKTAAVQQVAQLLGHQCERINLSASTTLDHLLGCTVPRVVDGEKQFEWQDGKLVEALREGRWLLLDEVNLAPAEVLEGIAPLLGRCAPQLPAMLGVIVPSHVTDLHSC